MSDVLHALAALATLFIPLAFAFGCIALGERLKRLTGPRRRR